MTEFDLARAFGFFYFIVNGARYELVMKNVYLPRCDFESDIIGIRPSGYIDEIEIKLNVSDFRADFKKQCSWRPTGKHTMIKEGKYPANRFSFLVPEKLLDKIHDEIPDHIGIYTWRESSHRCGGWITEKRQAKLIHKKKVSDSTKYKLARKGVFRWWLSLSDGQGCLFCETKNK